MGVNLTLQNPSTPDSNSSPNGHPSAHHDEFSQETLIGLLNVFDTHFGAQYPCVDVAEMRNQISRQTGSKFLLYCVCGLAAR